MRRQRLSKKCKKMDQSCNQSFIHTPLQELHNMHSTSGRLNLAQRISRDKTYRARKRIKQIKKLHKAVQIRDGRSASAMHEEKRIGDNASSSGKVKVCYKHDVESLYQNPASFGDYDNSSAVLESTIFYKCMRHHRSPEKSKPNSSNSISDNSGKVHRRKKRCHVHTASSFGHDGYATKRTRSGQVYGR